MSIEKRCFKCKQLKPLGEFYKAKTMSDGHLGKCKVCTIGDVATHRELNLEKIRAYDRSRGRRGPTKEKSSIKKRARTIAGNMVRDLKLERKPCVICGTPDAEMHHEDYTKPDEVIWLCSSHHKQYHANRFSFLPICLPKKLKPSRCLLA